MNLGSILLAILLLLSMHGRADSAEATAGTPLDAQGKPSWAKGAGTYAQKLLGFFQGQFQQQAGLSPETAPASLPQTLSSLNANGVSSTYLSTGNLSPTAVQPFFLSLGSNGRTCLTCHLPSAGWSITPSKIKALFKTNPGAPLFQPVDGAVCPTADTSTAAATARAYSLLINKGLIRVFIPMPSADVLQFSIVSVSDPYDCTNNPSTGLTGPTTGIVSQYRRPLASANLPFLSTIMWDGREPSLTSQASDAVMIHAQGAQAIVPQQAQQIADFESALFAAQSSDKAAGDLTTDGAQGGPVALAAVPYTPGENAPGPKSNPDVMTAYTNWINDANAAKASIARGQTLFNERSFTVSGVSGLNDATGKPSIAATCSACHNTLGNGSHSSVELLDLGMTNTAGNIPGGAELDVGDLPVFTVQCNSGPLAGQQRQVTDLGRAMITGQCADIGKIKTASLRNLSARPPYFHNGSAAGLADVVDFYDRRFGIGLSDQDKTDLVAFLSTL